jgi:hypothetical protein
MRIQRAGRSSLVDGIEDPDVFLWRFRDHVYAVGLKPAVIGVQVARLKPPSYYKDRHGLTLPSMKGSLSTKGN